MKYVAIFLIKLYKKVLSPFFPNSCRFTPTCSSYAVVAYQRFGFFKGTYLAAKRILRCNPFFKGGIDEVPLYLSFRKKKGKAKENQFK